MARPASCFIIGPMEDDDSGGPDARLTRLKDRIVGPVLEELTKGTDESYRVSTPYDLSIEGGAQIIRDVIYNIDRADIVVADLTDGNPNVFYELGITHALGRPCVAVLQEGQPIQFDINAYRVFPVDLSIHNNLDASDRAYNEAQHKLLPALQAAHRARSDWSMLENPVIDYYHAPMTYVSPAPALAEGYVANFILPIVGSLTERIGSKYIYDIGVAKTDDDVPTTMDEARALSNEERDRLDLQVVVPTRIDLAKHYYADRLRGRARVALVTTPGRTLTLWAYESSAGRLRLLDIPTTLQGVKAAVRRRMRFKEADPNTDEWRSLEAQEIDRFVLMLRRTLRDELDIDEVRSKAQIIRVDRIRRDDALGWIHDLFPAD
jgi:hypothetical protein